MILTSELVKKLVYAAGRTKTDEVGCDYCFSKLEAYAEKKLKGKSPGEAMPLIEDHLQRCGECREEYEALLAALKAVQNPAA